MADEFFTLNHEHPDYKDQFENWTTMEDLYTGSTNVKDASTRYLPMTPVEAKEYARNKNNNTIVTLYQRRLQNSVFFNGVARLTKYAMGHMFRNNPIYPEKPDEIMSGLMSDCDLMGTDLTTFIRNMSVMSYISGHHMIAVDFPNLTGVDSRSVEKLIKPRPYFIPVGPKEVINWKVSRSLDGSYQYDWLVHRYSHAESPDPFIDHKTHVYYKVWYKDRWELYRAILESENISLDEVSATKIGEGINPLGVVPYIPLYSDYLRPMVSKPPLLESANLNIDHYRTMSYLMNALMYHMNPVLVLSGVSDEEVLRNPSVGIMLPRHAEAKYVETQGSSLKVVQDVCESIAKEMWESGLRSSSSVGANTSAEARRLTRSDFQSTLLSIVNAHEAAYEKAVNLAYRWAKKDPPKERAIKLNRDFDISVLDANQAEFLLNARKAGEISKKLFMKELRRGEIINKTTNVDEELAAAAKDLDSDLAVLAKAENIKAEAAAKSGPTIPINTPPKKKPATSKGKTK